MRWLRRHCVIAMAPAISRAVLAVIAMAATVCSGRLYEMGRGSQQDHIAE